MSCPDKYDLLLTDEDGVSHGLLCDWGRGGAGLKAGPSADISRSTAVSTKGDYGVRDANDAWRIIQTDWSQGAGQKTYDREVDSESAFDSSKSIDVSTPGEFKLGPLVATTADTDQLPYIISHGIGSTPAIWASFTDAGTATERIARSYDGVTWTPLSSTGPGASPIDFASDGEHVFAVIGSDVGGASGPVHYVSASDSAAVSTEVGLTKCAFTAGYLYATKGSALADPQLGYFSALSAATWTALSPAEGTAINANGATFGLVALGSYVYWGITNGTVTSVYKARYGGATGNDVLALVATFPTGFVGTSMFAYLDTVYVGGFYPHLTDTAGIGSIYAIVEDTPALLTDVGEDKTADNRVLAISAYERNLFFVSNSNIWRWDLVNGGYSHWAGPLDSTATLAYTDITWDTWAMTDGAPGVGAETDATLTESGTVTLQVSGGDLISTLSSTSASATYETTAEVAGFVDATGETMEVDVPANFINDHNHSTYLQFGIKGSAKGTFAFIVAPSAFSSTYAVYLRDGTASAYSPVGSGASITAGSAHTLRLTLLGSVASLYCDDVLLVSGNVYRSVTDKKVWFKSGRTAAGATPDNVSVSAVRWSDDGAFSSSSSLSTAVTGVGLACWRDQIAAACSGVGCTFTSASDYQTTVLAQNEEPPYLKSSRSAGNMPTVDKHFSAIHVSISGAVNDDLSDITVSGTVDGQPFAVDEDATASSDTLLVFPLGLTGRNIQYQVNIENDSTVTGASDYTPVITEVAVLFTPVPEPPKTYSYFIRCWQNAEGRVSGFDWDEDAEEVADWLEEKAGAIVYVERPGRTAYRGRIEAIEMVEAPPSKANGREGLYQIQVRQLS